MRERLADFAYQHALARVRIVKSELADAAVLGAGRGSTSTPLRSGGACNTSRR